MGQGDGADVDNVIVVVGDRDREFGSIRYDGPTVRINIEGTKVIRCGPGRRDKVGVREGSAVPVAG